jgi:hypothetical protein
MNPGDGALTFSAESWRSFLAELRHGAFEVG